MTRFLHIFCEWASDRFIELKARIWSVTRGAASQHCWWHCNTKHIYYQLSCWEKCWFWDIETIYADLDSRAWQIVLEFWFSRIYCLGSSSRSVSEELSRIYSEERAKQTITKPNRILFDISGHSLDQSISWCFITLSYLSILDINNNEINWKWDKDSSLTSALEYIPL